MQQNNKILIIDDDQNLLKTLEDIFNLKGYQSKGVINGRQAVETIEKEDFPITLIDLKLGDMPGLDVLRKIKEISPHTECIITTGYATTDTAIEAVNSGAYSYLQKPYDIDQLLLTIRRAFERIQNREELTASEDRYQQLYEGATDGILATDLEGNIRDFNNAFLQLIGYSSDELRKQTFRDLTPDKYQELENRIIKQILDQGFSDVYEKEFIRKDGTLIPVEISGYLTKDKQGNPSGMWGFIRDISERKEAEKKLKRQLLEVTALHAVSTAGTTAENIDQLIEKVTETLGQTLYSDTFGVNIYDRKNQLIIPHFSYHSKNFPEKGRGFDVNLGITGRAVRTKTAQMVGDVSKDKDFYNACLDSCSELAVPIIVNNEVFGVLNAESSQIDFFHKEDLDLLASIARQMTTAIERIKLRESQQRRTSELTALYETSLAITNIVDAQTLYEKVYRQVDHIFHPDAFLLALFNVS